MYNSKIIKRRTADLGFIVLLIIFAIPSVMFFTSLADIITNNNIVNNGEKTTAVVLDYYSNERINGVDMYRILYEYTDELGNTHQGETTSDYTLNEAERLKDVGIEIAYDKNTFKSVQANFSFSFANSFVVILCGVFAIVEVVVIVLAVRNICKIFKRKKALTDGVDIEAELVDYKADVYVNRRPIYKITVRYLDEDGNYIKKDAKTNLSTEGIYVLKSLDKFNVKLYGGEVFFDDNVVLDADLGENNKKETENEKAEPKKVLRCLNCGANIDKGQTKCPYCQGKKFGYDI